MKFYKLSSKIQQTRLSACHIDPCIPNIFCIYMIVRLNNDRKCIFLCQDCFIDSMANINHVL